MSQIIPKCLEMISVDDVVGAIRSYSRDEYNWAEPALPARQSCCGGSKPATVTEKVVNAAGAAGRVVSALVNGEDVLVLAETAQARMALCLGCEHLWAPNVLQCKLCGCWVKAKTKLATEKCPAGKW